MSQLTMLGEPAYDSSLQQWHTSPKLAARMAAFANLLGASVLEPSAGDRKSVV